jgi:predicted  nucleic acid-binding Zn-ribbon protein
MLDKNSKSEGEGYRSPARKLIKFFQESRDQWKAKCLSAKYQIKLLSNKIRYLEKRKTDLKKRVKELENELEELQKKKR